MSEDRVVVGRDEPSGRRRGGTIRSRLLVAFVLIALIPSLITVASALFFGVRGAHQRLFSHMESVAVLKEAEISAWVDTLETDLTSVMLDEEALGQMHYILTESPESEYYDTVHIALSRHLLEVARLSGRFESIFLINADGQVVLSTRPEQEGERYYGWAFFSEGMTRPGVHVVWEKGVLWVAVVRPIRTRPDVPEGVLVGRVGFSMLQQVMDERTGLGDTGETFLVSPEGAVLTDLLGEQVVYLPDRVFYVSALDQQTSGYSMYRNYEGRPVIGMYRWLPEIGLTLFVEQAQSEAFLSIYVMMITVGGVALLNLLGAVLVALFTTRRIANPLADLATIAERIAAGEKAVVRFRVPRPGATEFADIVRGDMRFEHAQVDDFVILRSDGTPTYHLASTVDDVDYAITHVIRGEDLLSSTPKHILLTEAMGADRVTYAHLSLLMGPDGKKLSKRHGDTAMAAYRETGYLPEALNNYLALLGWNIGDDETIASLDEMIDRFDLSTVSKNPAVFDPKKLEWMNGVYIREMDEAEFVAATLPLVEESVGRTLSEEDRARYAMLVPLVKERAKLLPEVASQARFLFVDIDEYDEKSWSKVMAVEEGPVALDGAIAALEDLDPWTTETIDAALRTMIEERDLSARKGFQPIRVAVSGSMVSPPLFESLEILGRDETLARIRAARSALS